MMFKKVTILAVVLCMVFAMAGCGSKPAENSTETPKEDTSAQGEKPKLSGELTVWSWDVAAKALQEAAVNFNKIYPDVKITVEDLGTDQVYDKMTTGLVANVGLPDVVTIEGERVASFAGKFPEGFVDLTDAIKTDDFLPVKISECKSNGKLVAFPWDAGPAAVYYRTDLFEKAGIKAEDIKTWDDFIAAGKVMNEKVGVKMVPLAASRNANLFGMILNQLGSYFFDAEGNTTLYTDAAIKAMSIIQKMYDEGITYDNTDWDGLVSATQSGKIATVPSAVWWAGTLMDEVPDLSGKWAVMRLPKVGNEGVQAAVYGGSNVMIPAATQNREAAVEFVKFAMTDMDTQITAFTKYGLFPSYIPTYDDPAFDQEVEYFGGQKIWKFFAEVAKEIPELYYTEDFPEVYSRVIDAQAKVTLKHAEVKATLDALQKDITNMLGK